MDQPDRIPSSSTEQPAEPQTPPPLRQSKEAEITSPFQVYTPPMRSPRTSAKQNASTIDQPDELDNVISQLANEFALEDKLAVPVSINQVNHNVSPQRKPPTPLSSSLSKRPQLRLKLEDMPTPQQAEDRAQRAANRLIAKREAMEKAMEESEASGIANLDAKTSATQNAILRMNFKSYSSGDDSDVQSPSGKNATLSCLLAVLQLSNMLPRYVLATDAGRRSAGSAYSPNHGMFTTKSVAVSEAGISSPDSDCLHLQENLEKVREVGRGASGIVYKAIHIPTLKVVAIKVSSAKILLHRQED